MKPAEHLARQRIMVTGASGFLGSHLCRRLGQIGSQVHGISRSQRSSEAEGPQWWQGDMANIETARGLLGAVKPDVIFHLAGQVTAAPDRKLVLGTFRSLLASTVNLLTVAAEVGCRCIVLIGSLTEPQLGKSDDVPSSPYAAAKWASTIYGRMFHELYHVPVVIVRLFMTYGPGQNAHKLIPYVTLSLLRGEAPKLTSGQWQADWIYVDDAIEGLVAAAHVSGLDARPIDLGTGILVPMRDLVEQLADLIGSPARPLFGTLPDRPREEVRAANTAYAYEKLGWKPRIGLRQGLEHTVEWYRRALAESAMELRGVGSPHSDRTIDKSSRRFGDHR